jgi:hypothetical protein
MTPVSKNVLYIFPAAMIGVSISSGSYNCWPCLLGDVGAGVAVWLGWFGLWHLRKRGTPLLACVIIGALLSVMPMGLLMSYDAGKRTIKQSRTPPAGITPWHPPVHGPWEDYR